MKQRAIPTTDARIRTPKPRFIKAGSQEGASIEGRDPAATAVYTYRSVLDFLGFEPKPRERMNSTRWRGLEHGATRADAFNAIRGGYPEGVRLAEENLKAVELPRVASVRRRQHWSDDGDEVDYWRLRDGDLDHAWKTTRREIQPGSSTVVRICCDIGAQGGMSVQQTVWRGAAALALADSLEGSGRSVEIWAYSRAARFGKAQLKSAFKSDGGKVPKGNPTIGYLMIQALVKAADEPLNKSRVAGMLIHPSAHRYGMFKARSWIYAGDARGEKGCFNGNHIGLSQYEAPPVTDENEGAFIVNDVWSQEHAQQLLDKVADQLGRRKED